LPAAVVEKRIGVEIIVAVIPVDSAVFGIRAAASGYVHESSARVAVLGVESIRLHAHFLHGVGRRAQAHDINAHVRNAIEQKFRARFRT
jgi:hypothetical protein